MLKVFKEHQRVEFGQQIFFRILKQAIDPSAMASALTFHRRLSQLCYCRSHHLLLLLRGSAPPPLLNGA
jgi:hypothetical protein